MTVTTKKKIRPYRVIPALEIPFVADQIVVQLQQQPGCRLDCKIVAPDPQPPPPRSMRHCFVTEAMGCTASFQTRRRGVPASAQTLSGAPSTHRCVIPAPRYGSAVLGADCWSHLAAPAESADCRSVSPAAGSPPRFCAAAPRHIQTAKADAVAR